MVMSCSKLHRTCHVSRQGLCSLASEHPFPLFRQQSSVAVRSEPGKVQEIRALVPHLQDDVLQHRQLQAAHEDSRQRPPQGPAEHDAQRNRGHLLQ